MNCSLTFRLPTRILLSLLSLLTIASCESEKKNPPAQQTTTAPVAAQQGDRKTTVAFTYGQAGGRIDETFTITVTVSAIDASTRQITLQADDGSTGVYTAGRRVRNFDQIHIGDKVTATFRERLLISVHNADADPQVVYATALMRAPKGARPGAMVAQSYAIVATVKSIDADSRIATLQFSDGQSRRVPIRADVDLSKYNVGDIVVIQVNQSLSIIVENPKE